MLFPRPGSLCPVPTRLVVLLTRSTHHANPSLTLHRSAFPNLCSPPPLPPRPPEGRLEDHILSHQDDGSARPGLAAPRGPSSKCLQGERMEGKMIPKHRISRHLSRAGTESLTSPTGQCREASPVCSAQCRLSHLALLQFEQLFPHMGLGTQDT